MPDPRNPDYPYIEVEIVPDTYPGIDGITRMTFDNGEWDAIEEAVATYCSHIEPCAYTLKATQGERIEHYLHKDPENLCSGFEDLGMAGVTVH